MARINTYFKDKSLTNDDLLLGSSYEGMGSNGPIYKTRSYRLVDLAKYMNLIFTVDEVNYNLHDLTNNLIAVEVGLGDLETALTTKINTDIALLQTQTTESITLLDNTLSTSISDLADTVTTEVTDLNAKIISGDTALSAEIVALNDTLVAETTTLTNTINTLDTNISDQLVQVNIDIANALQTAIDSGELATTAQANIDSEIIAREDADGAIAARIDTIDTQFQFSTEDGSIIGAAGALNQTINTAASTAAGAVATRVDVLETEYELSTEDGSILGLAANSVTNVALTTLYGSAATRIDEIETQFSITDGTITGFSTAAQTRIDTSISNATSAQFQTLDTIKTQFVFTDGAITAVSDVIEASITDSISDATSAQFLKLDEIATQFVFDGAAISGVQGSISSTIDSAKLEAISTADTAAQNKVDTFAAKIVTTDELGNITGLSDAVQTSVSDVIAQDGYAESSRVDALEATVGDANGGLVASVTTNQEAIATVDGKLTASYGLEVDAGGNIASMRLFSDANSSEIRFNADAFKIWNGTAGEAPFEVSGGVVKIKSANIGSVSFGNLTNVPDTFITTVIYADDIDGTNPSTTKGTKNFVAFYNSSAAWADGDALPAGLAFSQIRGDDGATGPEGPTGEAGVRIATGILFYQLGSDTAPTTPSSTGITYNFDDGTFSSYPTDWGEGTPEMEAGTASNKYWTSRYQVIESSSGSGSGTPSFFTPIRSFAFNQVVTFDSLGSSGTTVIDGSRITTGFIRSGNWDAPDVGETFADAGTALYLNTGAIISKTFVIDDNGNAFFKGDITGASGTFSGSITGASGTFGGVTLNSSGLTASQFSIDSFGNASFGGALDVGTVVIDDGYVSMRSNSASLEGTIQFIDESNVYSGSIYASNTANQRGIGMYSADKSEISATNGASIGLYGDTYTINPGHVRIYSTNGTDIEGGPLSVFDLNIIGSTIAATGYTKLANGLILQWATVNNDNSGYTNGFWPVTFGTRCIGAVATRVNASSAATTSGTGTPSDPPPNNNAINLSYSKDKYEIEFNDSGTTAFIMALGY